MTHLDSGLDSLNLDRGRFVQTVRLHIHDLPSLPINTELMFPSSVFSLSDRQSTHQSTAQKKPPPRGEGKVSHPKFCQNTNSVPPTILNQSSRDDFHRLTNSPVRPPFNALDAPRLLGESNGDSHLSCSPSRRETGVEDDVAGDGHRVREVAVDLVEDVFRGSAEEDRAGFGGLAFC